MNYLAQEGICNEPGKIAIVDIGWRGTIQDNICRLFPEVDFYGFYLGLIPFLNAQPQNALKSGFINIIPCSNVLLKSLTQLEMLCSSDIGSVLRYESRSGTIFPVFEKNDDDVCSWNAYAKFFQEGVLSCIKEFSPHKPLRMFLMPLTLYPDRNFAKAFFRFRYSERFGLGQHIDQSETIKTKSFFGFVRDNKKFLSGMRAFLNQTKWPQGYLTIRNMYLLIPFYNLVLYIKCNLGGKKD